MTNKPERDLLLLLIEHVGKEWEKYYRPEDVRLSEENLDVLLSVNALVAAREAEITPQVMRDKCPTFVSAYRAIMLRDIQERIPSGTDEKRSNSA